MQQTAAKLYLVLERIVVLLKWTAIAILLMLSSCKSKEWYPYQNTSYGYQMEAPGVARILETVSDSNGLQRQMVRFEVDSQIRFAPMNIDYLVLSFRADSPKAQDSLDQLWSMMPALAKVLVSQKDKTSIRFEDDWAAYFPLPLGITEGKHVYMDENEKGYILDVFACKRGKYMWLISIRHLLIKTGNTAYKHYFKHFAPLK